MKLKAWWGVGILFILFVISSIYITGRINELKNYSGNNMKNISDRLDNIYGDYGKLVNNEGFSEYATNIDNSTVLVLVKKNEYRLSDKVSGGLYVDENGVAWGKGTAFSIGDGLFLSASHIMDGVSYSDIKFIWNGKEYANIIQNYTSYSNIDLAIVKTNLSIPSVNIIDKERAALGSKIGFIGFPLEENNPILHDGIISSVRNEEGGFFWYTINSFVNRGNSGGPVFLADTGEIVGIVSSRQNEAITIPQPDMSKLTEGEKEIMQMQIFLAVQLASNSQVGIGQIIGINQNVVNNIKNTYGNS